MKRQEAGIFLKGIINSYSQLFFADSKVFAWLLLCSSFINLNTGISGMIAVVAALAFSWWAGLDRNAMRHGSYSFNALMVGLVMGSGYELNLTFALVLSCAAVISVLFCVLFYNLFQKYKVPAMSLPFLCTLWIMIIALRSFSNIPINTTGIFRFNELYRIGGITMVNWVESLDMLDIPRFIDVYLRSLSAIFFQYNLLAGLLVMIGILAWSRIAWLLSIFGFSIGYFFYGHVAGEFSQLLYSYIGFNFILTAITLGGFFVVPSRASFVLALIATPVIAVFISGFSGLLSFYQLPLYSLPFNATVILFMLLLNTRTLLQRLALVPVQYFSPEKNLYHYLNNRERFRHDTAIHIDLPFWGTWQVSQGYDGKLTHKEEWKHALDFVVTDEKGRTYRDPGTSLNDFYCYKLPVLAPAAGYVVQVVDDIDDNAIGDVNLEKNWGNTVIIRHHDQLYSKLSHLKPGSILVKEGDHVYKGQVIASCGSSGRSPEPHLHFQLQETPYVGSKTLSYPLSYYMSAGTQGLHFHSFEVPDEGRQVFKVQHSPLLGKAFYFIPGVQLVFDVERNGNHEQVRWDCAVDAWNRSYLYCRKTNSYAYFVNNGTLHYFTGFSGNKHSLLYHFYLAAHKVLLGYYEKVPVHDSLSLSGFYPGLLKIAQDLVAPFYRFLRVDYQSHYTADDPSNPASLQLKSTVNAFAGNTSRKEYRFRIDISANRIQRIHIHSDKENYTATCVMP